MDEFLKEHDSMIFFFDEGRFGLRATMTRVWAEKGKRLEIKVKQGYKSFYSYSAISPLSGEDFSLFLPEINTEMINSQKNIQGIKYLLLWTKQGGINPAG